MKKAPNEAPENGQSKQKGSFPTDLPTRLAVRTDVREGQSSDCCQGSSFFGSAALLLHAIWE